MSLRTRIPPSATRRRVLKTAAASAALGTIAGVPLAAFAQGKGDLKIALLTGKTGALEAYAKQTITGFNMGLEYATGGTMAVAGRKLVVIEKDDQGKPDLGKSLLAAAYGDDKVDLAVGTTGSNVALAMLPVAEEYKKILIVEPAVADSITAVEVAQCKPPTSRTVLSGMGSPSA